MLLLHIIDLFTRYSAGCIIKTKASTVFVDSFLKYWISRFGSPKRLFSDNGGEFENEDVKQMGAALNIEVMTTAAYSPWNNGICERQNLTLSEIIQKVRTDRNCSWDTALQWALNAKNSLSNVHGYSAHQLVFGNNPNLPSVLVDELPALEGSTTSKVVGEHVSALYSARKAYTEAECSERIRRALRKQVRTSREEIYCLGDRVFYKRPDGKEWRGPGKVIGQDGVIVFVRHGGQVIKVHVCRLKKAHGEDQDCQPDVERTLDKSAENNKKEDRTESQKNVEEEDSDSEKEAQEDHQETVERQGDDRPQAIVAVKPGMRIAFKLDHNDERYTADVLGRAGKATGKHKNWYNIEYLSPEDVQQTKQSIDVTKVLDLETIPMNEDQTEEDEVMVINNVSFDDAKQAELESWKTHGVYSEVSDEGQKTVSTRWVCTLKEKEGKVVPKARLVARGFEEQKLDIEKDSPTCSTESLKMVLAVIAEKEWQPHSIDVKTAFLQGDTMEREVYLKPPKEAGRYGKVWRLNKCVYGLSDASLKWYHRVRKFFLQTKGKVSKVDPAVFFWHDDQGHPLGILACHVDDFLWGGTTEFENSIIKKTREEFVIGREESGMFKFVGIEVVKVGKSIFMTQDQYASEVNIMNIEKERSLDKEEPVTEKERSEMRSKVGQILWVARQTRPDVIFDASSLASRIKDAKVKDLLEANKVIKRIKTEKVKLKFQHLTGEKVLIVYTDASLGNMDLGGSQGGYFICLRGESGDITPLCWNSKRIRRVVRSTLAAEANALADGVDMAIFLASLYSELNTGNVNPGLLPTICRTDCRSLHDALLSNKDVGEKRLRIEVNGIKELLTDGQIKRVEWVSAEAQLADCLTKKGASCFKLMATLEKGHLV